MDLPYTYTDPDGDMLTVSLNQIKATYLHDDGADEASVTAPTGPDAVTLARAILAAAGDTGHEVLSAKEIGQMVDDAVAIGAKNAAEAMRERVLELDEGELLAEAIRALPLLPDTDTDH